MKDTPFEIPSENELEILSEIASNMGVRQSYEKGQFLFSQDSPVYSFYWLNCGLIKLQRIDRKQHHSILKVSGKNCFAGISDCFSESYHHYSATALSPVEVSVIDARLFIDKVSNDPALSKTLLSLLAKESLYYLNRLTTRYHKRLPGRVAETLLYFHKLFDNSKQFEFPLSRSELAQFAGTTKESFIRTLAEFRNDKIINIDDRNVEINSLEIVRTLSKVG